MSSVALTIVVTLAAVAAVYAAGAVLASRCAAQFARAAAPMLAAIAIGPGLVLPAFALFEPRHGGERLGALLPALAAIGAALAVIWGWRAARMLAISGRVTAAWARAGSPLDDRRWGVPALRIDTGAPVVAVAGLLRPRLFVDRRVLELCSDGELDAIAAHERAHVRSRDNVRRLLVGVCAGPRSAAAAAWRASAERAADRSAATSPRAAINLAAALVKLSRASRGPSWHDAILSTVQDGGSLESRVRHLLAPSLDAEAVGEHGGGPALIALAAILVVPAAPRLLQLVHGAVELFVRRLP